MTSLTLVQYLITKDVQCGNNISNTLGYRLLPHFDVACNQLLNRRYKATCKYMHSVRLVDQSLSIHKC